MKSNTDKSMTVRLPADLANQREKLIAATGRNKGAFNVATLRDYVEAEDSQIQDTLQAIAEADRGEFASDSEVNSFFAKFGG